MGVLATIIVLGTIFLFIYNDDVGNMGAGWAIVIILIELAILGMISRLF